MATTLEPTVETGTQTWALDAMHANVDFAIKHLMISTVRGRFGDISGTLKGDVTRPETFELEVNLLTESIDTRQAQRDAHLRSPDFFDALKWPTIRFVGKSIKGDVSDEFKLIGDLTIRDVTKEITLSVTNEGAVKDPMGNNRIGFSATAKVDRRDFGLTYNMALEAGGFVLGDEVQISVDAEFTAVPAEAAIAA
jgi:polyisoprenoid-binding protein YceI